MKIATIEILTQHTPTTGIMVSPTHWAYRGDWLRNSVGQLWRPDRNRETETPGKWFASCTCGWDSEPTTFETKDQARAAALMHVAEKIEEALS